MWRTIQAIGRLAEAELLFSYRPVTNLAHPNQVPNLWEARENAKARSGRIGKLGVTDRRDGQRVLGVAAWIDTLAGRD